MPSLSLSPFAGIIETQKYPHARTRRTSFSQKLFDCFCVVAGAPHSVPWHLGLFDYLTLFIPYLFLKLESENQIENKFLSVSLRIINIVFAIPRAALGIIVTVLFSPVITAVHGISRLLTSKKTYTDALQVQGKKWNSTQNDYDTTAISLRLYMQQSGITGFGEELETRIQKIGDQAFELHFAKKRTDDQRSPEEFIKEALTVTVNTADLSYPNNSPEKANLHALFTLNLGGAVKAIEEWKNESEKAALLRI